MTQHLGTQPAEISTQAPRIRVFGVGGAGGNAVAALVERALPNVRVIVANTDTKAMRGTTADVRLQLGRELTKGLGAGAKPSVGRAAAEESLSGIEELLASTDLCFIAAGMGGGTGTGAAPVIAAAARARGIATVAIVTMPFHFEGSRRAKIAEAGLADLEGVVDALIVVPNQNVFGMAGPGMTFRTALRESDHVLVDGVCSIVELVSAKAAKRVSFADLQEMLGGLGRAVIGLGESQARADRATRAADQAMNSPMLNDRFAKARRVIVAIRGGEDMALMELDEVVGRITEFADADAEILWGATVSPGMKGIRVSIIAEGVAAVIPALPRPMVSPRIELPAAAALPVAANEMSADALWAPAPPIDLADIVRPHGMIDPAPRSDQWLKAVCPNGVPAGYREPPADALQLMPRQVIARHHPSLVGRASGGARTAIDQLVARMTSQHAARPRLAAA